MQSKTIIVLDPTSPPKNKETRAAPRLHKLESGAKIGFLWNAKPNGDILLSTIKEKLSQRYHLAATGWYQKDGPATGALAPVLSELAANSSLVITAIAD